MNNVSPQPIPAQQSAIHPETSVWVTASAGSGKTKILTDRLLNLMLAGNDPQRLLCLTFTKAAAAEMSSRLHQRLSAWAGMSDSDLDVALQDFPSSRPEGEKRNRARQLFSTLLDTSGGFKIQTLHSFCQSLLCRFPLEAGLSPSFTVLEERDASRLLKRAQDTVIESVLKASSPSSLRVSLDYLTANLPESRLSSLVHEALAKPHHLRRFHEAYQTTVNAALHLEKVLQVQQSDSPEGVLKAFLDAEPTKQLGCLAQDLEAGSATDQKRSAILKNWVQGPHTLLAFQAYRSFFTTSQGHPRKSLASAAWAQKHSQHMSLLKAQQDRVINFETYRKSLHVLQNSMAFMDLVTAISGQYARLKKQEDALDYQDLITQTLQMLQDKADSASWVLYKLDGGIDHILIDEAQDTSWDQWRIIEGLVLDFFSSRNPIKTLFVVGDPKQSIYSFQGADPTALETMKNRFRQNVLGNGGRWAEVKLDVSFRSSPAILQSLDYVFRSPQLSPGVVSSGSGLLEHFSCEAKREAFGLVSLLPSVPAPEKFSRAAWAPPLTPETTTLAYQVMAQQVVVTIQGLLGEPLHNQKRPLSPRDIMILVRRRGPFLTTLIRLLKEQSLPTTGLDRLLFTEQLAVLDLIRLGECLLLPTDDLTLATVLKGPLFSFSEDDLFHIAYGRGDASLWSILRQQFPDIAIRLDQWRELSGRLTPFAFYHHLLGPEGGMKQILSVVGLDARDAVDEFLNLALAYEHTRPPSLQGFLSWINSRDIEVQRDLSHTSRDEIRLMTIHGSKGLQAPVVILPDMGQSPRTHSPLLWGGSELPLFILDSGANEQIDLTQRLQEALHQGQYEEYNRLLYVAMSRAEERLILGSWQPLSGNSWAQPVWEQFQSWDQAAAFTPPDGQETGYQVMSGHGDDNGSDANWDDPGDETTVAPSLAQMPPPPLPDWATTPPPSEPERRPTETPSQKASDTASTQALEEGQMIHALLASLIGVDQSAWSDAIDSALSPLPPAQQRMRRQQIKKVLENPDIAFLFGPSAQWEVPLTGFVEGAHISGQIDCLVITDTHIQIIDIKTDRHPPGVAPDAYVRQLSLYAALLQPLYPGKPIRCALLWLSTGVLEWIEPGKITEAT